MRRACTVILAMTLILIPLFCESESPLVGVWSNGSRFVEFAPDGRMRFVLKTYYGFVYENREWLPYSVKPLVAGSAESATVNERPTEAGAFTLSLRYPKEKTDAEIPLALLGDAIYLRFFRKADSATAVSSDAPASDQAHASDQVPASDQERATSARGPLDGFWIAAGNQDAIRLYRNDAVAEFFTYYFSGSDYYRIRYWATDARPRDVGARFTARDGQELSVPKFIEIGSTLYTCVTSTGKVLRNYESGTFTAADGALTFKPSAIAFSGTAAAIRKPLAFALSSDGAVLALGAPYLVRSKVTDLSAEVTAHNALRRPPRKPIFDFMKLDFHWDEIERIRNNGKIPEKTGK